MEGMGKKFAHKLPPVLVPSSSNGRNGGVCRKDAEPAEPETEKATDNKAPQDTDQETKKLRRILASREYSQKYRLKQLHYILHLEREMKALQAEVAISSPRIKYADLQNSLLRAENSSMRQKLSAFTDELAFKEARYEELKRERRALNRHLYPLYQEQE